MFFGQFASNDKITIMCGRYGFIPHKFDAYKEYFELQNATALNWDPSFNIAPATFNPVVTMNSPKTVELMRWGLIPSWWKQDPKKIQFSTINARSEDIEIKPVFRAAFKSQRCLIPASFFYEWALTDDPKIKEPFLFKLKDREIFSFAGIYERWKDLEGHEIPTYSLLTTEPNEIVGRVHSRMPVILKRNDEELWADNKSYDLATLKAMCRPYPTSEMDGYHVNRRVGNSRLDNIELIKPEPIEIPITPSRPAREG